jgi:hypothetical protein
VDHPSHRMAGCRRKATAHRRRRRVAPTRRAVPLRAHRCSGRRSYLQHPAWRRRTPGVLTRHRSRHTPLGQEQAAQRGSAHNPKLAVSHSGSTSGLEAHIHQEVVRGERREVGRVHGGSVRDSSNPAACRRSHPGLDYLPPAVGRARLVQQMAPDDPTAPAGAHHHQTGSPRQADQHCTGSAHCKSMSTFTCRVGFTHHGPGLGQIPTTLGLRVSKNLVGAPSLLTLASADGRRGRRRGRRRGSLARDPAGGLRRRSRPVHLHLHLHLHLGCRDPLHTPIIECVPTPPA